MPEPNPYGTTYRHFVFGDAALPARQLAPDQFPEVLRGGRWTPLHDLVAWVHGAQPVSEEDFNRLVAEAGG